MKSDQLYSELKQLAEKLGIQVSERNFRPTGIAVRSGFCKVHENNLFLIDKHIKINRKLEILAEHLAQQPLESIYILPAVREYLDLYIKSPVQSKEEDQVESQGDAPKGPEEDEEPSPESKPETV